MFKLYLKIAIRKVLGASVYGLVMLFSKDFIKLILISFLITVLIAYYNIDRWLSNFVYHIEKGAEVLVIGELAAGRIVWLTVGFQSIRTARVNPIESLRYE